MECSNVVFHDCTFQQYLEMPGYSFSGLSHRRAPKPTPKMALGTRVHNYLLDAADFDFEDLKIIKPLAIQVKKVLGDAYKHLIPEKAVTADFCHEGFTMKYKGRIDLHYPGVIVIDLKISENKDLEWFGYVDQVSGYTFPVKSPHGIVIKVHPKTMETNIIKVPITHRWWNEQIKIKGDVS